MRPIRLNNSTNKWNAKKTPYDDPDMGHIIFDSGHEMKDWCDLRLRRAAGEIIDLKRQVWIKLKGLNETVVCRLRIDFEYIEVKTGKLIHQDSKGALTAEYKLKRKLYEDNYGRKILET